MTTLRIEWTQVAEDGRGDVSVLGLAGADSRMVAAVAVALQASSRLPARERAHAVADGLRAACAKAGVAGVRCVVDSSDEERARVRSGGVLEPGTRAAWGKHRAHVMGGVPGPRDWPADRAADPRTDCPVCARLYRRGRIVDGEEQT